MATATYIIAHSLSLAIRGKVLYELLFSRKTDPLLFCSYGCPAYVLISKEKHGEKFKPHACKAIMLGYRYGQQAYKLLDLKC